MEIRNGDDRDTIKILLMMNQTTRMKTSEIDYKCQVNMQKRIDMK